MSLKYEPASEPLQKVTRPTRSCPPLFLVMCKVTPVILHGVVSPDYTRGCIPRLHTGLYPQTLHNESPCRDHIARHSPSDVDQTTNRAPPLPLNDNMLGHNYFTEMCSGSEEGSYLRLIDFCITQL